MTPIQDEAFTEFLRQKAAEAEAIGYRPNMFKKMLNTQGGASTVRQLLSKGKPTEGFVRLYELGRLDLSVEALAVESKWRPLIDEALLHQAEKLLRESRYSFKPFTEPDSPSSPTKMTPPPISAIEPVPGTSATPAPRPPKPPKQRKNDMAFSEFCRWLGAPLVNIANRWCGYNRQRGFAVFTLWADRLQGGRYLLWDSALRVSDTRIGAKELQQVLRDVMAAGHTAYGILSEAKDTQAEKRERGHFDEQQLLVLRLEASDTDIVAHVMGAISAADLAAGRQSDVMPFDSAIDDLDAAPPGQAEPERIAGRGASGYRRDAAVRSYVIKRSKGRCEYCGTLGFELTSGSFYVEAHHVIALSAQGPDTVANVIALCPAHHRQAHYGKNAEALEADFLKNLRSFER